MNNNMKFVEIVKILTQNNLNIRKESYMKELE